MKLAEGDDWDDWAVGPSLGCLAMSGATTDSTQPDD